MTLRLRKNVAPDTAPNRCPIGACMELLAAPGPQCDLLHLQGGARRFSELQTYMAPISAKVLSQRLKELEAKHVVSRKVSHEATLGGVFADPPRPRARPAIEAIAHVGYKLKQQGAAVSAAANQPPAKRTHKAD